MNCIAFHYDPFRPIIDTNSAGSQISNLTIQNLNVVGVYRFNTSWMFFLNFSHNIICSRLCVIQGNRIWFCPGCVFKSNTIKCDIVAFIKNKELLYNRQHCRLIRHSAC